MGNLGHWHSKNPKPSSPKNATKSLHLLLLKNTKCPQPKKNTKE